MTALADLGPLAQLRAGRLGRRLPQLLVGLWIYGVSLGLMVRGNDGVAPWDVLHLGIVDHTGLSLGTVLVITAFAVLLLWIPLREKPGIGTVANALIIGPSTDATLAVVGQPDGQPARIALMLGGVVLCALATAMYIGAQFGRGPRDGLMTGLVRRTGLSIRLVRTSLEVSVVVIGLLLGGPLGVGTIVFALTIGPLTQWMLPAWTVALDAPAAAVAQPAAR
ncbi:YitT family protein [Nocardioides sp. CER28]